MACADCTEITIPNNMWNKPAMLRESSEVSLGSLVSQSSSTIKRVNGIIHIDRISGEVIGEQEEDNPRFEREEDAIREVVILPTLQARTNERSRLIIEKTCIVMV